MNIFTELVNAFLPDQSGFLFMWILLAVAFTAVILIIERWINISRRTNVDSDLFTDKIRGLIREKQYDEAYALCSSAGPRAFPRIIGAAVKTAQEVPEMIRSSMEEETLHHLPVMEKRVNIIMMLGNVSTLLGLMGTIYGLILSFAAVARPDVSPVEKSSLLASGISTAMNTTLFGLIISVPCIFAFSLIRSKIDRAVQDIDRYCVAVLKELVPGGAIRKDYKVSGRRVKEEVDTEPNIAPMMNLMVILIPMLLTSSEFVKLGAIELKLPKSSQEGGGAGQEQESEKSALLNCSIAVTGKGFNIFSYFSKEENEENGKEKRDVQIPLENGKYDFVTLNRKLAEIKKKALGGIIGTKHDVPENVSLYQLYREYNKADYSGVKSFKDHEALKIVAVDSVKYQTIISVMDAARGLNTEFGKVTMFPEVSLAGGIAY